MPESISSKIIVLFCISVSSTTLIASKNLDSSPPDAILLIGFLSIPVLVEAKNMTLSIPSIEQLSKSISSNLISKFAFSNFK